LLSASSAAVAQVKLPAGSPQVGAPTKSTGTDDPGKELSPLLQQFIEVLSTVRSRAADEQPVDKLIYEGAIPSMLRKLDPHTEFFEPSQFQQLQQMENSEQKGFGSVVSVLPGQVIFLQTLPGTPSNKAGIQAGDELLAVNNILIRSLEPEQIVELLSESRQQKVTLFVRRQGSPNVLQFSLTPELVDTPSVDRAFLLDDKIGYVRIASWDLQTAKQLKDAIQKLGSTSLEGLVLDLRNNPGGIVKAALDGASMFLQPGQRILTAKGRATEAETADVPKNSSPYSFRMSVLINGKTASASEIFAGALQDHDRAVIVGEPSYGKGLVQSVMPLSDGAGLALTTAFYYTPSGRSIQRPLQDSALSETFKPVAETSKPTFKTDKGRLVKGGGGIVPDIIVGMPIPTKLEAVLDASGAMTAYATHYLASHPHVTKDFQVTSDMLDDLKVFLSEREIQPDLAEWSNERAWITERLKEEIATQAFGVESGDQIEAKQNAQVQAAVHSIRTNLLVAADTTN
jgi:carboxyl-terminal processing protease